MHKQIRKLILAVSLMIMLISGCVGANGQKVARLVLYTPTSVSVAAALPATQTPLKPFVSTSTPVINPTALETSTPENSPTPDFTPTPEFTPTWSFHPSGSVIAPILLYHRVSEGTASRYRLSPTAFRQQMAKLAEWGYTSVTISQLVDAIATGSKLPAKPVVISFDDGYRDLYEVVFPIMQEYGFVGTAYIIMRTLDTQGEIQSSELKEMAAAGWEIGSHSYSHNILEKSTLGYQKEFEGSRQALEEKIGVKIRTFSYPYGDAAYSIRRLAAKYGYDAAVGLGTFYEHTSADLYYLSRIEIQSDYDLGKFASLLPWSSSVGP